MKAPIQSAKLFGSAASAAPAQRKGGLKTIVDNRPTMAAQRKMQGVAQRKGQSKPLIDGKVIQREWDCGLLAGIGAAFSNCLNSIWGRTPGAEYDSVSDTELESIEVQHLPELQTKPKSDFFSLTQNQGKIVRVGDRVHNAGTTSCGLVVGIGENGVAAYHWPFMSIMDEYDDKFQELVKDVGPLKSIHIVTNYHTGEQNKETYIKSARHIQSKFRATVTYHIHEEKKDLDPYITIGNNGIVSISNKTTEVDIQSNPVLHG